MSSKARKAKKEHTCDLCLCPIQPGEDYLDRRGVGERGWFVWKEHLMCHRVMMFVRTEDWLRGAILDLEPPELRVSLWEYVERRQREYAKRWASGVCG